MDDPSWERLVHRGGMQLFCVSRVASQKRLSSQSLAGEAPRSVWLTSPSCCACRAARTALPGVSHTRQLMFHHTPSPSSLVRPLRQSGRLPQKPSSKPESWLWRSHSSDSDLMAPIAFGTLPLSLFPQRLLWPQGCRCSRQREEELQRIGVASGGSAAHATQPLEIAKRSRDGSRKLVAVQVTGGRGAAQ